MLKSIAIVYSVDSQVEFSFVIETDLLKFPLLTFFLLNVVDILVIHTNKFRKLSSFTKELLTSLNCCNFIVILFVKYLSTLFCRILFVIGHTMS